MTLPPTTNVCHDPSNFPSILPSYTKEERDAKMVPEEQYYTSSVSDASASCCDDFPIDTLAGELFLQSDLSPRDMMGDSTHGFSDMFPSLNDLTSDEALSPQILHESWSIGEDLEYPSPNSLSREEGIKLFNNGGILQEEEEEEEEEELDLELDLELEEEEEQEQSISQMFAQWLRSNSHAISLEDLRRIKLKTSTIENATRILGGGKKGLMLFIKFVLNWVQNCNNIKQGGEIEVPCNLDFLRPAPFASPGSTEHCAVSTETEKFGAAAPGHVFHSDPPMTKMRIMNTMDSHECSESRSDGLSPWWPGPASHRSTGLCCSSDFQRFTRDPLDKSWIEQATWFRRNRIPSSTLPPSSSSSMPMHEGTSTLVLQGNHEYTSSPSDDSNCSVESCYHSSLMTMAMMSQQKDAPYSCSPAAPTPAATTRAARKSRMERKRLGVRRNRKWSVNSVSPPVDQCLQRRQQDAVLFADASRHRAYGLNVAAAAPWSQVNIDIMSSQVAGPTPVPTPWPIQQSVDALDSHGECIKEMGNDRVKLLFQKELKQSDVGNLGRIVLPKKAAETYLPHLESRDGMNLGVEDFESPRVWNMRYRFWPNNKSRMYLLENTGNFVRSYNLKEGDSMQLYFNLQSSRYMVRGTKGNEEASKREGITGGSDTTPMKVDDIVEMNSKELCDDPLLVELIEQSLEDFGDPYQDKLSSHSVKIV